MALVSSLRVSSSALDRKYLPCSSSVDVIVEYVIDERTSLGQNAPTLHRGHGNQVPKWILSKAGEAVQCHFGQFAGWPETR